MGFVSYTDERFAPVRPATIFKPPVVIPHHLMPKVLREAIKSIKIIKDDGGDGSIERIDYTVGEGISDKIENMSCVVMFHDSPGGGTILKMYTDIDTRGDFEIEEEELKEWKQKVFELYMDLQAYLKYNPDAYA